MKITIDDCLSDNADSPSKFNEASGVDCSSPEPRIDKPTASTVINSQSRLLRGTASSKQRQ